MATRSSILAWKILSRGAWRATVHGTAKRLSPPQLRGLTRSGCLIKIPFLLEVEMSSFYFFNPSFLSPFTSWESTGIFFITVERFLGSISSALASP